MLGRTLSHYHITRKLGAGGMGEVYLAEDTVLGRSVAIKILPPEFTSEQQRLRRFFREAKAASAISHPNVAHIYEVAESDGIHFIAMEYIQGETLASRIKASRLAQDEIVRIAIEITDALLEAHARGIIHRDLKPANIMLTPRSQVKLLDFGLAKLQSAEEDQAESVLSTITQTDLGAVMGTLPYMSPEQLRARQVDPRTDIFSLGVVLCEVASGKLPFTGKTSVELADAILNENPDVSTIAAPLRSIISKALAKDPDARYQTADEMLNDLNKLRHRPEFPGGMRRRTTIAVVVLLFCALVAGSGWFYYTNSKKRWAREEAIPEILQLVDQARFDQALALGTRAEAYIPDDRILASLWQTMSTAVSIDTNPAGAEVEMKKYQDADAPWQPIGQTPLNAARVPKGYVRLKISKPGFAPVHRVVPQAFFETAVEMSIGLDRQDAVPPGMVKIPDSQSDSWGVARLDHLKRIDLQGCWMDQYEVSNKEYKKFVDAGGYQKRELWKHPFLKDGRTLTWDEAMTHFQDTTGRPGPLEWEVGNYPSGKEDHPVTGISWYEAAAYAEFMGKSLPTIHHWLSAAGTFINFEILPLSNFAGRGPHPIGNARSMSLYGTYDMAGNVKEWCWNDSGDGKRFILGGSYLEPEYLFVEPDFRSPFDREKTFGFRCVKYISKPTAAALKSVVPQVRDYTEDRPVNDEVFSVLKRLYEYPKRELRAKVEAAQEEENYWRKETVMFDAAYGNERIISYIFLPKNRKPPFQTIVYFPGSGSLYQSSSEGIEKRYEYGERLDFLVRSGRAAVFTVIQGTYERGGGASDRDETEDQIRRNKIQTVQDICRTMDYLQTRDDIAKDRIAYYGYSWGARMGTIVGAVENRFRTMILAHGGLPMANRPPDIDEMNFAPRVKVPVLMINGKYDHIFPVEDSQKPMFRLLGSPAGQKAHMIFDGGHTSPRNDVIKAVLDWLDHYLGPV